MGICAVCFGGDWRVEFRHVWCGGTASRAVGSESETRIWELFWQIWSQSRPIFHGDAWSLRETPRGSSSPCPG